MQVTGALLAPLWAVMGFSPRASLRPAGHFITISSMTFPQVFIARLIPPTGFLLPGPVMTVVTPALSASENPISLDSPHPEHAAGEQEVMRFHYCPCPSPLCFPPIYRDGLWASIRRAGYAFPHSDESPCFPSLYLKEPCVPISESAIFIMIYRLQKIPKRWGG